MITVSSNLINEIFLGKPSKLHNVKDPDLAPTLKLGHNKVKSPSNDDVDRCRRVSERATKRARLQEEIASKSQIVSALSVEETIVEKEPACNLNSSGTEFEVLEQIHEDSEEFSGSTCCQTEWPSADKECQTDLSMAQIYQLEECNRSLFTELSEVKNQLLTSDLSQSGFEGNNEKTQFYTGIPTFSMLMQLFTLIAPHVVSTSTNALCQFQEYLLVLLRLRLNVPLQDLAYRFKVSVSTASRVFNRRIDVMRVRLDFLIQWPEREELRKTKPLVFRQNFGLGVAVIIDCFEIFTDRPSSFIARGLTWSNYKHHNTVKLLIGITPQGVIRFLSNAWGGRVSDKHLTENCGLLNKLLPGDIVLADMGFDIADSVGFYQATLKIPAFTRGKRQLSAHDIQETRKIANVRIHVERVIGLVRRKYVILQSILPVELITAKPGEAEAPIDKIARVCCALTNLSDSIVPFE